MTAKGSGNDPPAVRTIGDSHPTISLLAAPAPKRLPHSFEVRHVNEGKGCLRRSGSPSLSANGWRRSEADCSALERLPTSQPGITTDLPLDPQELIELGDPFPTTARSGLDVTGPRRHGEIGDRRVFCLSRTVRDEAVIAVFRGKLDGVQRLGQRANLVELYEDRVADALLDSLRENGRFGAE